MSESKEPKGGEDSGGGDGEPLTIPQVVWAAARWLAKRELLVRLAVIAFLLGLGGVGVAYAYAFEERRHEPIEARISNLEQVDRARDRKDLERDRLLMEMNLNVRLFLQTHGVKPIDVPREMLLPDGGP